MTALAAALLTDQTCFTWQLQCGSCGSFFQEEPGCTADTAAGGIRFVRELYERTGSQEKSVSAMQPEQNGTLIWEHSRCNLLNFDGLAAMVLERLEITVQVPVLFDKKSQRIVNNESSDIIRIFAIGFKVRCFCKVDGTRVRASNFLATPSAASGVWEAVAGSSELSATCAVRNVLSSVSSCFHLSVCSRPCHCRRFTAGVRRTCCRRRCCRASTRSTPGCAPLPPPLLFGQQDFSFPGPDRPISDRAAPSVGTCAPTQLLLLRAVIVYPGGRHG